MVALNLEERFEKCLKLRWVIVELRREPQCSGWVAWWGRDVGFDIVFFEEQVLNGVGSFG